MSNADKAIWPGMENAGAGFDRALGLCESEIEKAMLYALWEGWPQPPMAGRLKAWLIPQFAAEPFRFDFVIIFENRKGIDHQIVVECDGHEFHERTKEQARRDRARDRSVQRGGGAIFRFTGSEIHRDAEICARETWDFAIARYLCAEVL